MSGLSNLSWICCSRATHTGRADTGLAAGRTYGAANVVVEDDNGRGAGEVANGALDLRIVMRSNGDVIVVVDEIGPVRTQFEAVLVETKTIRGGARIMDPHGACCRRWLHEFEAAVRRIDAYLGAFQSGVDIADRSFDRRKPGAERVLSRRVRVRHRNPAGR